MLSRIAPTAPRDFTSGLLASMVFEKTVQDGVLVLLKLAFWTVFFETRCKIHAVENAVSKTYE
jgi:hypothetical protein